MTSDYRTFYDLEGYLFNEVGPRWRAQGWLSPLDFFAIVVWKSNRSKTLMRDRVMRRGHSSLEDAVRDLTSELARLPDVRAALKCLMVEWKFQLPMASAVLCVLFPDEATVYDLRVCSELKTLDASCDFERLGTLSRFDAVWEGYEAYTRAVRDAAPPGSSLRDKDRWLWGRSFHRDLVKLVTVEAAPEASTTDSTG